jgi:hypothetical protein
LERLFWIRLKVCLSFGRRRRKLEVRRWKTTLQVPLPGGARGIAVNLRVVLKNGLEKVSPPFEGGVAAVQ